MPSSKFVETIEKWKAETQEKINAAPREVIKEIARRIVRRSPIDTSRFVANWIVSEGRLTGSYDPTLRDPSREMTLHDMFWMLDAIDFSKDVTVYIANHAPYAVRLEYGWSQRQAPEGMVRLTVAEFAEITTEVFILGGGSQLD